MREAFDLISKRGTSMYMHLAISAFMHFEFLLIAGGAIPGLNARNQGSGLAPIPDLLRDHPT